MNAPSQNLVDGLLLVDKPSGPTSHDVVAKLRRHLQFKKIGHGGTLDPMATGLLILLLGRGTKLSNYVMGSDKIYEGTMHLGITTDSQDADGEVTEEQDASAITEEAVRAEMAKLSGDLMQIPPMVSAIKKNGVPLYKLARKGKTVERDPRLIHVYSFKLQAYAPPRVHFRVSCTKGTYVRTLAHDIGQALGCGAHLCTLRRTKSGPFSVNDAATLDELLGRPVGDVVSRVIPPHRVDTGGITLP